MLVEKKLKERHIQSESERWDKAIKETEELLNHRDPEVRKLIEALLTMHPSARFNVFGSTVPELNGYHVPHSTIDILECMDHFVSYSILDDGEPGVGYWRYDLMDGFVACDKNHPDAKPYFHRWVDELREKDPEAEYVSVKVALRVVKEVDNEQLEYEEWTRKEFPEDFVDEEKYPDSSKIEIQEMKDLVKELKSQ